MPISEATTASRLILCSCKPTSWSCLLLLVLVLVLVLVPVLVLVLSLSHAALVVYAGHQVHTHMLANTPAGADAIATMLVNKDQVTMDMDMDMDKGMDTSKG